MTALIAVAGGVRARLRGVTDEIHQALHDAAPFAAIAQGAASRADYAATLGFLHRYHSAMADICAAGAKALGAQNLAAAHSTRIAALGADLDFLNAPAIAAANLPSRSGAFAAGCLYTVQGSTLGGKVIFRQLDYLLPGNEGRSFFKGTAEDSKHWQTLCAALEQQHDIPALEEGALFAFTKFRDLLPHQR